MRKFIFGTDWWTDCDDVVAMRLLARAVNRGEIQLLGVGINACMEYSVASVDGFLALEGLENVPLSIDFDATDFGGRPPYQKRLAQYARRYSSNSDAESLVSMYRRILSAADEPIEIIEVGYLQGFTAFMQSKPDEFSPLSGMELLRTKVKKVWVMAGKWDIENGKENNFARNQRSRTAAEIFCRDCPVPVTFLGLEIGLGVLTGGKLNKSDHLHLVLCDHGSESGRCSWDPMLTLMALIGDEEKAGYRRVVGHASVDGENGENRFTEDVNGLHAYVVRLHSTEYYRDAIDSLISSAD